MIFTKEQVKQKVKDALLARDLDINEFLNILNPPRPTTRQIVEALEELKKEGRLTFEDGKLKLH